MSVVMAAEGSGDELTLRCWLGGGTLVGNDASGI
jgi:hypothetical protein